MSRRVGAVALSAASAVMWALACYFAFVWGSGWSGVGAAAVNGLFGAPFVLLGLLISLRRPQHPIGWSFAFTGLVFAVQSTVNAYADAALTSHGEHLPAALYVGNATQWVFAPGVLLGYTLPFLWFPDGRLLSPRWRWAVRVGLVGTVFMTVMSAIDPGPLTNYPDYQNPLSVAVPAASALTVLGLVIYIGALFAAIASVFLRFRRSVGVERLQMRWFMVGVAGTGVAFALQLLSMALTGDVGVAVLLLGVLPVCATIAILRYRLFDIDRVVSRSVTYAVVTALLVAPYIVLTVAASRLARGSDIAVAALTLATLALLRPVRRRVQARVDRRFNRQRYDAGRTIDAFAGRLRDEVDPDSVRQDLVAVTVAAMQPSVVSLWVAS